jgi:superfamily II DNA or RNA helicase
MLGVELGYRVNTYTAQTPLPQREKLRRQFESAQLQGLVAIRCLDEGVDIPAIKTAVILASSSNPRQFVQRRGRILRPYPGKERATLFDMIVLPPELDRQTWEVERNLLRKELKRFVEFADLADNAGEARIKLLNLQKKYGLLDI